MFCYVGPSTFLNTPRLAGEAMPVIGVAHMFSSSPTHGADDMELMYLMAITAATHSIFNLASAYFVPMASRSNALVEAARPRRESAHCDAGKTY